MLLCLSLIKLVVGVRNLHQYRGENTWSSVLDVIKHNIWESTEIGAEIILPKLSSLQ
jgi:hypothetical protein